jgi:hypothetical protein
VHWLGLVAETDDVEEVQRNQLKVVSEDDWLQLTGLTVREFCSEAAPEITGLDRATGALRTNSVDAVTRTVDLRAFFAVTLTARYLPTSDGTSSLVEEVAPLINLQLLATVAAVTEIKLLQLNHWYA